jgi:hypothetical protein
MFWHKFTTCNVKTHLATKAHKITETSDETAARQKARADATQAIQQQGTLDRYCTKKQSVRNAIISFVAATFQPFSVVETESFRALVGLIDQAPLFHNKSIRNAIIVESNERLAECLRKLKGERVTIALDSGTIWNRYLAVSVLSRSLPPLVVSCVADTDIGGTLTAANITAHINEIIRTRLSDCHVVGVVADNASNMQLSLKQFVVNAPTGVVNVQNDEAPPAPAESSHHFTQGDTPAVCQPCFAHTLQLVLKDVFKHPKFNALIPVANATKLITGVSESIVKTRWNTVGLLVTAVLKKHDEMKAKRDAERNAQNLPQILVPGGVPQTPMTDQEKAKIIANDDHVALLRWAKPVLDTFIATTDRVQNDNATLWDAILALQEIHDKYVTTEGEVPTLIRGIIEARCVRLLFPGVLLLAYLAPNVPALPPTHPGYGVLLQLHLDAAPKRDRMFVHEFSDSRRDRAPVAAALTRDEYMSHQARVPGSTAVVGLCTNLLNVAPTEAAIERLFSKMKLNATAQRTSLKPESATAQIVLNSCADFLSAKPEPLTGGSVEAATFQWIIELGARALRAPEVPESETESEESDEEPAPPPPRARRNPQRQAAQPARGQEQAPQQEQPAGARRHREAEDDEEERPSPTCANCGVKHRTATWIKCDTCNSRVSAACARAAGHTDGAWRCRLCYNTTRRAAQLQAALLREHGV